MSSNAVALRTNSTDLIHFDDKKRELIRSTIANKLTESEFSLFMAIAGARGLDPVLGQIHAVKRKFKEGESWVERLVIQVGIDGLRLIASRTGEYAGADEITFETENGKPTLAKATIYRIVNGAKCAFTGTARWAEYCPGERQGFMWAKMPFNQLGKCAEAQALRRGFPGDLGGLYEGAELEREEIDITPAANERDVTSNFDDDYWTKEIKTAVGKFAKLGVSEADICAKFGVATALNLTLENLNELKKIGGDIVNKRVRKEDAFKSEEKEF